jgi:DNA-binding transcriptional ArsR family regulator
LSHELTGATMNKVFLWWLIAGSKGGENRARIILELNNRPYNANKLAQKLSLDYKTIRHHIDVLNENNLVKSTGESYGALYFLSDEMESVYDTFLEIWEEFKENEGHN